MARANAAYYAGRDPFADFITAPEISQIFGELLGAWCAVCGTGLGGVVRLVEVGPGRGTLMADMLRVLGRAAPDMTRTLSVHLVETSPRLREIQKQALARFGMPLQWHDDLADVPGGTFLLVGNEFLDALPIRQFVRTQAGWQEHFVRGTEWVLQDAPIVPADVADRGAAPGEIVETCPAAQSFVAEVAARLKRERGAALFIDYGTARSLPGETLQALREGRSASPLVEPGTADLTAHVDFATLATVAAAADVRCFGPIEQGRFLTALGAVQRGEALCTAAPGQAGAIRTGLDRLIAPERMGRLFKVLALASAECPIPPGFPETGEAGPHTGQGAGEP